MSKEERAKKNGALPAGSQSLAANADGFELAYEYAGRRGGESWREPVGLTKREEFAKAAMQGLCAKNVEVSIGARMDQSTYLAAVAEQAVRLADALLLALEETKE